MSQKILVIDDDMVTQNMLVSTLTKAGYSVIVASNGNLGLEAASSQLPGLIILDIIMPGKDGIEVASILKRDPKTDKIPIIFLSTLITERGKKSKSHDDSITYLSKPYNVDELLSEIRKYL